MSVSHKGYMLFFSLQSVTCFYDFPRRFWNCFDGMFFSFILVLKIMFSTQFISIHILHFNVTKPPLIWWCLLNFCQQNNKIFHTNESHMKCALKSVSENVVMSLIIHFSNCRSVDICTEDTFHWFSENTLIFEKYLRILRIMAMFF
jgi:hypothetical protein